MLLRYKEKAVLKKSVKTKQPNGSKINTYETVDTYTIQSQTLEDEVSVSIYGNNISKVLRITSTNKKLENYLYPKVTNEQDNISDYFIFINNVKYKINSATKLRVDIERL